LLIGKGNSRNQPAWSTFVVSGRSGRRYLPDRARLLADGVWLDYGHTRCSLRVKLEADQVRVAAALGGAAEPTRLQLQLRLQPSTRLRLADGTAVELGEKLARIEQPPGELSIGPGHWSIELPRPWTLDWPVGPFNPYAKDGAAPLDQAAGILGIDLPASGWLELIVRRGA
jgi:hypothetical protein